MLFPDPSDLIPGPVSRTSSQSTQRKKKRRKVGSGDHLVGVGGRDCSLYLFRALGKILYGKREQLEVEGKVEGRCC